jgi:hypothetical protein
LCGGEEVIVAGFVEPITDCRPKAALGEGGDEAQLEKVLGGETTGTSLNTAWMSVAVSL